MRLEQLRLDEELGYWNRNRPRSARAIRHHRQSRWPMLPLFRI